MRTVARVLTGALFALGLVGAAGLPAEAHEASFKGHIAGVNGGASSVVLNPAKTRATWRFNASKGGLIELKIKKAEDPLGGKAQALGNTMEMDLVLAGVPSLQNVPFDIVNGTAKVKLPSLGLTFQDVIEVRSVTLRDSGGVVFGQLGFVSRTK